VVKIKEMDRFGLVGVIWISGVWEGNFEKRRNPENF
jgi:hypothetical protein